LHMAHQMPLQVTVSCFSKSRLVLPFWYRLIPVILDKAQLVMCACMRACVCLLTLLNYICWLGGRKGIQPVKN